MEQVPEVNESDRMSEPDFTKEPEMSMDQKRKLHRSRERHKFTLGGEIQYTEEDYAKMNLIWYRENEDEGWKVSLIENSEFKSKEFKFITLHI